MDSTIDWKKDSTKDSTKTANDAKNEKHEQDAWMANDDDRVAGAHGAVEGGRGGAKSGRRSRPQDSWVDAIVTLLATIVFGLGWTLIELERADPPLTGYDAAASELWVAAVASSIETRAIEAQTTAEPRTVESVRNDRWGDEDARWTEPAPQNSNR